MYGIPALSIIILASTQIAQSTNGTTRTLLQAIYVKLAKKYNCTGSDETQKAGNELNGYFSKLK